MAKKTILCAFDFSESSLQALRWTMVMAEMYKAQVTFLYCYRLISANDDGELLNIKRDMESSAASKFHEIEKKIKMPATVPYQFISEVGFFSSRIEQFIRKTPVELVVIGNSVVDNFNEFRDQSFDQFLSTIKVPIVIAPKGMGDFIEVESTWNKS